jgi:hypothetical protein
VTLFSAFTVLCSRSAGTFHSIASSMLTLFRMMLGMRRRRPCVGSYYY